MTGRSDYARLSERLIDTIIQPDLPGFVSLFALGATFWDNVNRVDKAIPEIGERLRLIGSVATSGFESSRRLDFDGGFVQTGVLSFVTADEKVEAAVALIVWVDDSGLVTRTEEYLDSAAMVPLHRALTGGSASS